LKPVSIPPLAARQVATKLLRGATELFFDGNLQLTEIGEARLHGHLSNRQLSLRQQPFGSFEPRPPDLGADSWEAGSTDNFNPANRECCVAGGRTDSAGWGWNAYNGLICPENPEGSHSVRFRDVTDGLSNTYAIGEQSNYAILAPNDKLDLRACNHVGGAWNGNFGHHTHWWLNVIVNRYPINAVNAVEWTQP
jgi:hypothetical protein